LPPKLHEPGLDFGRSKRVPAHQGLSANLYAYGLGNPLAYTDPSGHIVNAIGFVLSHPSLVILLIPGIGEAYGLACAVTGQDLLTGEQLSPGERLLFAAGALGTLGKLGSTLAKMAGKLLSTLGKSLGAGMRAMGTAVKALGRGMRELGAALRTETKAGGELRAAESIATRELRATEMAQLAGDAHKSLTTFLRNSTVAAGIKDGRVVYAVHGGGRNITIKAIEQLRARGLHVLDAPKVLSELTHAERQLYSIGIREIGISRKLGMCSTCKNFINEMGDAIVRAFGG
jgi:hypothetical protein